MNEPETNMSKNPDMANNAAYLEECDAHVNKSFQKINRDIEEILERNRKMVDDSVTDFIRRKWGMFS